MRKLRLLETLPNLHVHHLRCQERLRIGDKQRDLGLLKEDQSLAKEVLA
jgi:hypothetical protein